MQVATTYFKQAGEDVRLLIVDSGNIRSNLLNQNLAPTVVRRIVSMNDVSQVEDIPVFNVIVIFDSVEAVNLLLEFDGRIENQLCLLATADSAVIQMCRRVGFQGVL